ncbi:MAG: hypothetical protein BJ554DRAFT_2821 [Olpidium bornovanus]|uniref:Uncharacterized protein n=1 Tax=Olpidium bornovanus TaxID=278681 RepID=A0A8H8DGD8_9FUNG|nr:MAG: hypothetical protein BJ554DRAFT_2821 [Olpidium bornovanus]
MPGKMSFRAALVAASLAAFAALQVTSAQIVNLPPECPQEKLRILRQPVNAMADESVNLDFGDDSPAVGMNVEPEDELLDACGLAAAKQICKSKGFDDVNNVAQFPGGHTLGKCFPRRRFDAIATVCTVDFINVFTEPTLDGVDLNVTVKVLESTDEQDRICGFAAAKQVCKTNPRGFATAVDIIEKPDDIFEGKCEAKKFTSVKVPTMSSMSPSSLGVSL